MRAKASARKAADDLLCKRAKKTPVLSKYLSAFSRHNYGHINAEGKRTYRYSTGGVLWRRRERNRPATATVAPKFSRTLRPVAP